jgi:hypothetical protein
MSDASLTRDDVDGAREPIRDEKYLALVLRAAMLLPTERGIRANAEVSKRRSSRRGMEPHGGLSPGKAMTDRCDQDRSSNRKKE